MTNQTQYKRAAEEVDKPLHAQGGKEKMTETQKHEIRKIIAIKEPRTALSYTIESCYGIGEGVLPNPHIIYNPNTRLLEFLFDYPNYVGEHDFETVKKFLGEENSRYASPVTRKEIWGRQGEHSAIRQRTWLSLREQFEGSQFAVLEVFPHIRSALEGFRLGFKIKKEGQLWGIVTGTYIDSEEGACYNGLRDFKLGE